MRGRAGLEKREGREKSRAAAHLTPVAASFAGWERKKGLLCSLNYPQINEVRMSEHMGPIAASHATQAHKIQQKPTKHTKRVYKTDIGAKELPIEGNTECSPAL